MSPAVLYEMELRLADLPEMKTLLDSADKTLAEHQALFAAARAVVRDVTRGGWFTSDNKAAMRRLAALVGLPLDDAPPPQPRTGMGE